MKNFEQLVSSAPKQVQDMLEELKTFRERPDFHPEESTFEHIRIVTERLMTTGDPDLIMTGFFHDLFKLKTATVRNGFPSSPGHDTEVEAFINSEGSVREFIRENGADPNKVAFMCGQHMRVKHIGEMSTKKRNAVILDSTYPSLLMFTLADRMLMDWDTSVAALKAGDKDLVVGDVTLGWLENAIMEGTNYNEIKIEKTKERMSLHKITGKDLLKIGYKQGPVISVAMQVADRKFKHTSLEDMLVILKSVLDSPADYLEDDKLGQVADFLIEKPKTDKNGGVSHKLNDEPLPYKIWGADGIERGAVEQMDLAMRLPVARAGALMADGHAGYSIPIGGVLALHNAVSVMGVGIDIGCRMSLSIYDVNSSLVAGHRGKIANIIGKRTSFGVGSELDEKLDDTIMDDDRWSATKLIKDLKDKSYAQLGSSGGGNHFCSIGEIELLEKTEGLEPGKYAAILTHSGSRGFGARIADYYSKVAMQKCILQGAAKGLAWLDMNSEEGQEYWLSMNLALDYASACHRNIHLGVAADLGWTAALRVENHHNFAAKEMINGEELIVHRKGATPAGAGVLGFIPGTMADPSYLVRGLGNLDSLNSASHGAGRAMSRTVAKTSFTMSQMNKILKERDVTLIGSSIDESPMAYKDIRKVMAHQQDLVTIIGEFTPRIVRMASDSAEF